MRPRSLGYEVDYLRFAPGSESAQRNHIKKARPRAVRMIECAEHRVTERLKSLIDERGVPCEVTSDNIFVSDPAEFARYTGGRRTLLLERRAEKDLPAIRTKAAETQPQLVRCERI